MRIENAIAVVSNPQTNIKLYSYYPQYLHYAWQDDEEAAMAAIRCEVVNAWSEKQSSQILYIQNIRDEEHLVDHVEPFKASLNASNLVNFYMKDYGAGHVGPKAAEFAEILRQVVTTKQVDSV